MGNKENWINQGLPTVLPQWVEQISPEILQQNLTSGVRPGNIPGEWRHEKPLAKKLDPVFVARLKKTAGSGVYNQRLDEIVALVNGNKQ